MSSLSITLNPAMKNLAFSQIVNTNGQEPVPSQLVFTANNAPTKALITFANAAASDVTFGFAVTTQTVADEGTVWVVAVQKLNSTAADNAVSDLQYEVFIPKGLNLLVRTSGALSVNVFADH